MSAGARRQRPAQCGTYGQKPKLRRYREGIEVELSDLWLLVAMFDN